MLISHWSSKRIPHEYLLKFCNESYKGVQQLDFQNLHFVYFQQIKLIPCIILSVLHSNIYKTINLIEYSLTLKMALG